MAKPGKKTRQAGARALHQGKAHKALYASWATMAIALGYDVKTEQPSWGDYARWCMWLRAPWYKRLWLKLRGKKPPRIKADDGLQARDSSG